MVAGAAASVGRRGLSGCGGACERSGRRKPPVPVKVAAVELNAASSGTRYSATIIPRTEVQLAFKVGGYVDALRKVRGVDGQDARYPGRRRSLTWARCWPGVRQSDYQVKFKEAESQASEARSGIDVSKAQYRRSGFRYRLEQAATGRSRGCLRESQTRLRPRGESVCAVAV